MLRANRVINGRAYRRFQAFVAAQHKRFTQRERRDPVAIHRREQLGLARQAAIAALRLQDRLEPTANRFGVLPIVQVRVPIAQEGQEREACHRRIGLGPGTTAIVPQDEPFLASAKTIRVPIACGRLHAG